MEETAIAHLFSNVGVPAVLCFYTMFNINKNIEKLTEAVNRWNDSLNCRLTALEKDVKALQKKE